MILLIGGTRETRDLAMALADAGFEVLVTTATTVPLEVGDHPNIAHRAGVLDAAGMSHLVVEQGVDLIVDASHPYATVVRANARNAALERSIPYLSWLRPSALQPDDSVVVTEDHEHAAKTACSFGLPALLTTGSRNLAPYVAEAKRNGVALFVRVLAEPQSRAACLNAGIAEDHTVTGRGPFSLEENLAVLRKFNIGVMVTKDSGAAGGLPEKLEAARIHGCRVVVVRRPEESNAAAFTDVSQIVAAVRNALGRH